MSLLMDALKKAEKEKKEAAKRLKEAQEKTGGQIQLQVEESEETSVSNEDQIVARDEVEKQPETPVSDTEKKTKPELSLSPLDASSEPVIEPEPPAKEPEIPVSESSLALKDDITIDHPEISELDDTDYDEEIVLRTKSDKTFAVDSLSIADATTAPFDDTANATLQEKHADTLSDSRISRSVVSAAELVKDMGGGKEIPTPVAAQTVFRASVRSSGKQQVLEWTMFIGLLTVVLVAAGSFYYLKITPLTPETSSPLVAKGIERELMPAITLPVPEDINTSSLTGVITGETLTDDSAGISDEAAVVTTDTTEGQSSVQEKIQESPPITDKVMETEIQPKESPVAADTENSMGDNMIQATVLPEKIQVEPAAIAISRSKSVDRKDQLINTAYSYYVAGDYSSAETLYKDVLKEKPDNRDALLGIAAIAYRKGNIQFAYEHYLTVLKYYPKDIAANTALVSLQDNTDPVRQESIIKLMIRENPDTAFLYFSLGNVYARQSRWAEAQQAFFEAWRLQSDNSDYAYNLAISLDHIGQSKAARDYYSIALDLADESQASFNTASVMARLNTLSE